MADNGPWFDLDVEVLIGGQWIRGRAHESRRGEAGQETLVSWRAPQNDPDDVSVLREAWVENSRIRAVHEDE